MTTRTLDFADGFQSAAAPTTGVISAGSVKVFASDAAYVADKGSAATEGDMYFNSTTNFLRVHDGVGFIEQVDAASTQTVAGDKTFTGSTTFINSANLAVADKNITVNSGGNDASAEGAGLTVDRTGTDGSLVYENALASKWKAGALGGELELVNVSSSQTLSGKTMAAGSNTFSGFLHGTQVDNPSSGVHGVTGSVLGNSDSQVVTNKDIDGGTASNTSRITLPKASTGTLSGLTRKQATLVYDTTLNAPYYDTGSTLVSLLPTNSNSARFIENAGVSTSVGASALTLTLTQSDGSTAPSSGSGSVRVPFRSGTLNNGSFSIQSFTATASVVVPSGATLGHTSAKDEYIYLYAIYDGTNLELAVSGARRFEEHLTFNTTSLSAASDDRNTLYSTTARTGVRIRLVARLVSNQTTAGTYAAVPTNIDINPIVRNKVYAQYETAAGQSIPDATITIIDFGTKVDDTHSAVTTGGSWAFTAPYSDFYHIASTMQYNAATFAASGTVNQLLFKNGSILRNLFQGDVETAVSNNNVGRHGAITVYLSTGDTINIRTNQTSGGAKTLEANANANWVMIESVGS